MYLRKTTRKNADGSTVAYYQLAENVWDSDRSCSVARVVHNFGRADALDGDSLRQLARSILRVCSGEDQLEVLEGVKVLDARPCGALHVIESIWNELGVPRILTTAARSEKTAQPFERAIFAMVANRMLHPYSKLYCFEQWLREDVFLRGAEQLELQHLYRGMDFLERHKQEIEKAIYFSAADLTRTDVDLIFYDTTSLHFEIDQEDEEPLQKEGREYAAPRKRGHSKNGRSDTPQIVIGLAVTRDGLPVRSWVFPGNTSDVTTVAKVKEELRGWKLGRCVFVGDAGMNGEENRRQLALGGGKYILASKMRAGDEVTREVLTRPGRYKTVGNLRVKEVFVGDGERRRRYVICHNPEEEQRQRNHREKLLTALQAELESMRAAAEHTKRMCELLTSSRFGRYLRETGSGLAIDRAAVREAEHYDGKWVVTSNDDTLTPEDLALGYKQLLRVEECWRTLKSSLRMRPVYHWRPWRIQAHVSLSVLALLIERIIELRASDTWRNVAAQLDTIKVVEYRRGAADIRQTTELRASVAALLKTLGVPPPPMLHALTPARTNTPVAGAPEEPHRA
jgi:transposase